MFVYVGTYTTTQHGRAEGIHVFRFDPKTGELAHVQTVSPVADPSFLVLDAEQRFLYAVNERAEGTVSAFARNPESGELRFINSQSSHGADPCQLSIDASGKYVLVANYSSGTVAALPIAGDGSLEAASSVVQHEGSSVISDRQAGPHTHMIAPTPEGQSILVTDLGTDEVVIYRLDVGTGQLMREGAFLVEPGSGPRHFAFSPNGLNLFVINELSSTLSVFAYDAEKLAFPQLQSVSTLPDYFGGENSCAHVVVSADGRYVYGSNRGHDSIAIWSVGEAAGEVSRVDIVPAGGEEPRNFAIDPTGGWLLAANQKSDTIVTFQRDQETGMLTPEDVPATVPTPVCIVFGGE